jgi:hypothetical protein
MAELIGRAIKRGQARGEALVSGQPVGFFGNVDPDTGMVTEAGHDLFGQCIAGRVLVFPTGKGSTVGSYVLYRLKRNGLAPAAIINRQTEPIIAVGAIIADIPLVDRIDIEAIASGQQVCVDGDRIRVG